MSEQKKEQEVSVLPGKYAFYEKLGDYERVVTFQRHEELMKYMEGEIDTINPQGSKK